MRSTVKVQREDRMLGRTSSTATAGCTCISRISPLSDGSCDDAALRKADSGPRANAKQLPPQINTTLKSRLV